MTITDNKLQFRVIVLRNKQNDCVMTGTDLPHIKPRKPIEDINIPLCAQYEAARLSAAQRKGWTVETWYVKIIKKDGEIKSSQIKVRQASGEISYWVNGWPLYATPDLSGDARLSTRLVSDIFQIHGVNLTQDDPICVTQSCICQITNELSRK